MRRDFVLLSSTVSELELPTSTQDQARAMAGQLATVLTTDRGRILVAAAGLVEDFCGRLFWRGALGGLRTSSAEVDLDGSGEIPIIPAYPDSAGVLAVTSLKRWDDNSEAYSAETYAVRPAGRIAVSDGGYFEITATVIPPVAVPAAAVEAASRIYAYQSQFRPGVATVSELGAITPPRLAGAILKSGSHELLQSLRRTRA